MKKLVFLLSVASLFSAENVAKSGVITNTITGAEGAQITDIHKRIREFVDKYKAEHEPQKFTAVAGVVFGRFKDSSSRALPLNGHNKMGFLALGYQFTPEISSSISFIKGITNQKSQNETLKAKSTDKTVALSCDYKLLEWLTLSLSYQEKHGKTITTVVNKRNVDSTSKNIFRTPGFLVKMTLPVNKNLFFGPDIGINRSCIYNKAYVDNDGIQQAKRTLHLDQAVANTKLGYIVNQNMIPYASVGYSRTLSYGNSIKSKNSFRVGAGAILLGGMITLDWSASRANQSVTSNNVSLNLAVKF
jgi:hypothetical protein